MPDYHIPQLVLLLMIFMLSLISINNLFLIKVEPTCNNGCLTHDTMTDLKYKLAEAFSPGRLINHFIVCIGVIYIFKNQVLYLLDAQPRVNN
jgi:hypothetical protein